MIVAVAALLSMMPAISLIDIRNHIIPNKLMYPSLIGFPVFLVVARLFGAPVDLPRAAIGFLAYGGGLFVIALISRGMGMGDVKLAALIGVVLGSLGLGYVGVAAAGRDRVRRAWGRSGPSLIGRGRKSAIPFGPYLALGAVVAAFWGQRDRGLVRELLPVLTLPPQGFRCPMTRSRTVCVGCLTRPVTWCFVSTLNERYVHR